LYLEKLKRGFTIELPKNINKIYLNQIKHELIYNLFPSIQDSREIHLSNEEAALVENTYSPYQYLRKAFLLMIEWINQQLQQLDNNRKLRIKKDLEREHLMTTLQEGKPVFGPSNVDTIF